MLTSRVMSAQLLIERAEATETIGMTGCDGAVTSTYGRGSENAHVFAESDREAQLLVRRVLLTMLTDSPSSSWLGEEPNVTVITSLLVKMQVSSEVSLMLSTKLQAKLEMDPLASTVLARSLVLSRVTTIRRPSFEMIAELI